MYNMNVDEAQFSFPHDWRLLTVSVVVQKLFSGTQMY